MVTLIVFACLAADPQRCQEFTIPFQNEMNVSQCVWQSQVHAAEWSGDHPDWVIRKFHCALPPA